MITHLNADNTTTAPILFRRSRKEKYFAKSIEVTFVNTPEKNYSTLEINCPDQTGILASVGKILASNNISLKDARITTLGERVEDLFFITDKTGQRIEEQALVEKLQAEIKTELEERLSA